MFTRLTAPNMQLKDVIDKIDSESQRSSPALLHLLEKKTRDELIEDEESYVSKGEKYIDLPSKGIVNTLTNKEAVSIYTGRFSDSGARDDLLSEIEGDGSCVICGNPAGTLEHVLSKTKYSQYTVTPINLVPMCGNCNLAKGTLLNGFHPYFESFSSLEGIFFQFDFTNPKQIIAVEYSDNCPIKLIEYMQEYKMDEFLELKANTKIKKLLGNKQVKKIPLQGLSEMIDKTLSNQVVNELERWEEIYFCCLKAVLNKLFTYIQSQP
jgi:5-methylcytosine-specific restriction endonuclease McrA